MQQTTILGPVGYLSTIMNYEQKLSTMMQRFDTMQNSILSILPANLSLIKSNGCVASVETTPPLSPATRCSYLTPEKKESGTLVGVSLTSSDISVPSGPVYIIFGEIGVKCSPAHQLLASLVPRPHSRVRGEIWERD